MQTEEIDQVGDDHEEGGAPPNDDLAELEKLKKQNKDFFNELKSLKEKNKKFEDEKAKLNESKLKEEGKLKEVLDLKESEISKLSTQLKEKVFDQQVKDAALKAGLEVKHVKHFMMLAGSYKDAVKFDSETFEADQDSLSKFINDKKAEFKELNFFTVDRKAPVDGGVGDPKETEDNSFATKAFKAFTN
jgi:septal ring factor EnvC (AmiA/AmiB activator)